MELSINLDEYLASYDSFKFCRDVLKKYFKNKSPFEDTYGVLDDDGNEYYYRTNGSQYYYKELLKGNYNTLFQLISIHIDRVGEELSWHDWYIVASNAYKMKGNIAAVKYVLQHFGANPRTGVKGLVNIDRKYETDTSDGEEVTLDYSIERKNNFDEYKITFKINTSTSNTELTKTLLTSLARELLILDNADATFTEQVFTCHVILDTDVSSEVDYQLNYFFDLLDSKVIGKKVTLYDISDIHTKAIYETMAMDYTQEALEFSDDGYMSYQNTVAPLFMWYGLGRIPLKFNSIYVTTLQIDAEVKPVLIDAAFYYKSKEYIDFRFGFNHVSAVYNTQHTPVLNNDTNYNTESSQELDLSEFMSTKVLNARST